MFSFHDLLEFYNGPEEALKGGVSKDHALILYSLAKSTVPGGKELKRIIIELGTGRGCSTRALLAAVNEGENGTLYTVDSDPKCKGFLPLNEKNLSWENTDSLTFSEYWIKEKKYVKQPINLLFIDSLHTCRQCIEELESYLPLLADDGIIVLHDCQTKDDSYGVRRAIGLFLGKHPEWSFFEYDCKNKGDEAGLGKLERPKERLILPKDLRQIWEDVGKTLEFQRLMTDWNIKKTKILFTQDDWGRVTGGTKRKVGMGNDLDKRGYSVTLGSVRPGYSKLLPPLSLTINMKTKPNFDDYSVWFKGDPRWFLDAFMEFKGKKFFMLQGIFETPQVCGTPSFKKMVEVLSSSEIPKISFTTFMRDYFKEKYDQDSILAIGAVDVENYKPPEQEEREKMVLVLDSHTTHSQRVDMEKIAKKYSWTFDSLGFKRTEQELITLYGKAGIFVDLRPDVEVGVRRDWNNPVAEAMACKCPVLITPQESMRDVCIKNKTCHIVPEEQICVELEKMIEDKDFRKSFVDRAYDHIQKFSFKNMMDIIVKECLED